LNWGFGIYGLEGGEGNTVIYNEKFTEPSVFIIGNEHAGLREKTREHCDMLISIPISNQIESLNAGASAAVAFYEFRRQNP
jgi:23S rRNA (guanosine2251-2'-O)-methyltransferase